MKIRVWIFLLCVVVLFSVPASTWALTYRTPVPDPAVIYYPDGTTYTLGRDEVIHIAEKGDTVYTKAEGDDTITFIINYPNTQRDFDIDIAPIDDPCMFGGCDDPGE